MDRAERRRLERIAAKLTDAEYRDLELYFTRNATKRAIVFIMGLPLHVLRNEFGFGRKRLRRFMDYFMRMWEQYERDEITLEDLAEFVEKETGVKVL